MRLNALIWNRYRSFRTRQRVQLAPVTIMIGRNGSGKSVIARLPLLLARAVAADASGPLDLLAGGIEHASSYQDLANMRGALPFTLGFEVSGTEGRFSLEVTLRHIAETRSLAIEEVHIRTGEETMLRAILKDEEQLASRSPVYNMTVLGSPIMQAGLKFSGLLPLINYLPESAEAALSPVYAYFRKALSQPSYLGPFRAEPTHSTRLPTQGIRDIGTRGERAIEFLVDDKLRHDGEVGRQVAEWMSGTLGQSIDVNVSGDVPQFRMVDDLNHVQVGLSDTGAGFSQVLPIVVQTIASQRGRLTAPILIVEQPELHLHPAAHGDVADLMISSSQDAANQSPALCIVETHSEQFIMRVRRRIAEGLSPEHATLWSLNHEDGSGEQTVPLKEIKFDKAGNPEAWPYGVFEEALKDLTKLRLAARERDI